MATERFANNIQTTLVGTINNAVTSLTVASATGFPSSAQYRILIDSELMLVTAGAGTTTWTVTRGIEGTTAASHINTTDVIHVLTAGALGVTSDPAAGVPGLRTLGTGAAQAAPGNDARFAAVSATGIPTVVNVKDAAYGATGDGLTDDTPALAAAVAAVPTGGALYFPPGTYITSQLTNKSNFTMYGRGATIKRKAAATGALFNTASILTNIVIERLAFDNNNAAQGNPVFTFVPGTSNISWDRCAFVNHNAAIIIFTGSGGVQSTNVKIADCSLIGNLSAGANHISTDLKDVSWVWFERNYCENFGGFKDETSGLAAGVMHHLFCRDNLFRNCGAMLLEMRNNSDGVTEDVVISGNQGINTGTSAVPKGLTAIGENAFGTGTSSATRRVVISNNVMKDFWGGGILVGGGPSPGIVEDIVISDNILDGTRVSDGLPDPTRGSQYGIQTTNTHRFTITGNHVRGTGRDGIRVVQNSNIGSKYGTINNNHVSLCCQDTTVTAPNDAEAGIMCYGQVDNVTITGNVSRDNGGAASQGIAGIGTDTHSASTAANDHVITGNRCFDSRGTPFQDFGIRVGHTVGSTTQPTNFVISNNDVRGNVTAGVKVFSTTYKNHNIFNNLGDTVALGQMAVYDGTNLRDLIPGVNNLVLTTDSSSALGVKWATSGGGPITKVVSSDITITSQVTLQDITGLGVAIGTSATEIWLAKFWLLVNGSNATMDVKFGFTFPAATTIRWGFVTGGGQSSTGGWGTTAVGTSPVVMYTEVTSPSPSLGTVSGVVGVPIIAIIYGGATTGTAQIKFAQQISDAGTLKILKGSAAEIVPLSS